MESGLLLLMVVPPFPLKQTASVLKPDSHGAEPSLTAELQIREGS